MTNCRCGDNSERSSLSKLLKKINNSFLAEWVSVLFYITTAVKLNQGSHSTGGVAVIMSGWPVAMHVVWGVVTNSWLTGFRGTGRSPSSFPSEPGFDLDLLHKLFESHADGNDSPVKLALVSSCPKLVGECVFCFDKMPHSWRIWRGVTPAVFGWTWSTEIHVIFFHPNLSCCERQGSQSLHNQSKTPKQTFFRLDNDRSNGCKIRCYFA